MFWQVLALLGGLIAFVVGFWVVAFVAAMILSCPILFMELPKRRRPRLPTEDEIRSRPKVEPAAVPRQGIGVRVLLVILWPLMLVIFALVFVPAVAAMWVCAMGMN